MKRRQQRPVINRKQPRRDIFDRAQEQAGKRLERAEKELQKATDKVRYWSGEIPRLRRILDAFGVPALVGRVQGAEPGFTRAVQVSPLTPGERKVVELVPDTTVPATVPEPGEDQFLKD